MSMIRLELSNQDYNTIAEALLESALDREQCRHRRLARRRRAVLARLRKQKEGPSRSDTATRA